MLEKKKQEFTFLLSISHVNIQSGITRVLTIIDRAYTDPQWHPMWQVHVIHGDHLVVIKRRLMTGVTTDKDIVLCFTQSKVCTHDTRFVVVCLW